MLWMCVPLVSLRGRLRLLEKRIAKCIISSMSLVEIKHSIADCSIEQRLELAALITHLNHNEDPNYAVDLDARMESMDRGEKIDKAQLERLHKNLTESGK